jgi:hypothetical protein
MLAAAGFVSVVARRFVLVRLARSHGGHRESRKPAQAPRKALRGDGHDRRATTFVNRPG